MLMVIVVLSDIFELMEIWIGSIVVLLVVRIWVSLRRCRGRVDSRATTIFTVILYVLILAGMMILVVSGYWWVLFGLLILAPDMFLWLCFPVRNQSKMSVVEDKCDLCSNNLYGAGKPHIFGRHQVCGKCHIMIEEAKKEERNS